MSVENITVSCSPLTGTIYIGRLNKSRTAYLENRPAEGEVMRAVTEFMMRDAPKGSKRMLTFDGGKTYFELTVTPADAPASIPSTTVNALDAGRGES